MVPAMQNLLRSRNWLDHNSNLQFSFAPNGAHKALGCYELEQNNKFLAYQNRVV